MNILCNISLIVAASQFASDSKNNCTKNSPSIPYGRLHMCVCVCVCVCKIMKLKKGESTVCKHNLHIM